MIATYRLIFGGTFLLGGVSLRNEGRVENSRIDRKWVSIPVSVRMAHVYR